jgi:hypothetical protein
VLGRESSGLDSCDFASSLSSCVTCYSISYTGWQNPDFDKVLLETNGTDQSGVQVKVRYPLPLFETDVVGRCAGRGKHARILRSVTSKTTFDRRNEGDGQLGICRLIL